MHRAAELAVNEIASGNGITGGTLSRFRDVQEMSRFSCMLFLSVRRFLYSRRESWRSAGPPEPRYWIAAYATYCGIEKTALTLLREAVAHNYCAYPAMDRDVAFAPLHQNPEFATIRLAAMECQKRFTDHKAQRQ